MDIRTVSSPCFIAPRAHPAVMCPKLRLPRIRRTDHGGQRPPIRTTYLLCVDQGHIHAGAAGLNAV